MADISPYDKQWTAGKIRIGYDYINYVTEKEDKTLILA